MGIFLADRVRMLQLYPQANTDDLIQVLYSIFGDDTTQNPLPGGISTTPTANGGPAVTVTSGDPNVPLLSLQRPNGGGSITLSLGEDGLQIASTDPNGVQTPVPISVTVKSGTGNFFLGTITGSIDNNTYTCNVFKNGVGKPPVNVTVIQWQPIAPSALPIPDGTNVFVLFSGGTYYINVPTWL